MNYKSQPPDLLLYNLIIAQLKYDYHQAAATNIELSRNLSSVPPSNILGSIISEWDKSAKIFQTLKFVSGPKTPPKASTNLSSYTIIDLSNKQGSMLVSPNIAPTIPELSSRRGLTPPVIFSSNPDGANSDKPGIKLVSPNNTPLSELPPTPPSFLSSSVPELLSAKLVVPSVTKNNLNSFINKNVQSVLEQPDGDGTDERDEVKGSDEVYKAGLCIAEIEKEGQLLDYEETTFKSNVIEGLVLSDEIRLRIITYLKNFNKCNYNTLLKYLHSCNYFPNVEDYSLEDISRAVYGDNYEHYVDVDNAYTYDNGTVGTVLTQLELDHSLSVNKEKLVLNNEQKENLIYNAIQRVNLNGNWNSSRTFHRRCVTLYTCLEIYTVKEILSVMFGLNHVKDHIEEKSNPSGSCSLRMLESSIYFKLPERSSDHVEAYDHAENLPPSASSFPSPKEVIVQTRLPILTLTKVEEPIVTKVDELALSDHVRFTIITYLSNFYFCGFNQLKMYLKNSEIFVSVDDYSADNILRSVYGAHLEDYVEQLTKEKDDGSLVIMFKLKSEDLSCLFLNKERLSIDEIKIKCIISVLREGWKTYQTLHFRCSKVVSGLETYTVKEILSAAFGDQMKAHVEERKKENGKLEIRLSESSIYFAPLTRTGQNLNFFDKDRNAVIAFLTTVKQCSTTTLKSITDKRLPGHQNSSVEDILKATFGDRFDKYIKQDGDILSINHQDIDAMFLNKDKLVLTSAEKELVISTLGKEGVGDTINKFHRQTVSLIPRLQIYTAQEILTATFSNYSDQIEERVSSQGIISIKLRKDPATQTNILVSAPVMFSEASKPASQPSDSSTHPAIPFTKRQKDRIIMLLSQDRVYSDLPKLIRNFNPESAEDWKPKDILASVFGIPTTKYVIFSKNDVGIVSIKLRDDLSIQTEMQTVSRRSSDSTSVQENRSDTRSQLSGSSKPPSQSSSVSKPSTHLSGSSTPPAIPFTKRQRDRIIMLLSQERVYSDLPKLIYSFNPEGAEDWKPKDILSSVFGIPTSK